MTRARTRAWSAALLGAVGMLASTAPAHAQAESPAVAEALFHDGQRLLEEGRTAEACAKFEASEQSMRTGGTLLQLAACYEKLGRTATAVLKFREALAVAERDGRQDRIDVATGRIAALTPALPKLVVATGSTRPPGLAIRLDGAAFPRQAVGVEIPVDPGVHRLEASAPGHRPFVASIESQAGATVTVEVELALLARVSSDAGRTERAPSRPAASPLRTAGFVALAFGAVTTVLGGYFGVRTFVTSAKARDNCDATCNVEGFDAQQSARRTGPLATLLLPVGVAVAGAGVVLVLTHPAPAPRTGVPSAAARTPLPVAAVVSLRGVF